MGELLDFLGKTEIKELIQEHLEADVLSFLLNPPAPAKPFEKEVADQILARQKAKGKLPSWTSNPDLIFPPSLSVEQASSERAAVYKTSLLSGTKLVDLTGGMGIDSLALVGNFQEAIYVEQSEQIAKVFEHNVSVLGQSIEVRNEEALDFLSSFDGKATFFIDPARRDEHKSKVFKLEDCSPDLSELMPLLAEHANQVLVKLSPLLDIKSVLQEIPHVKEVHVLSIKNDCKELLILIDFSHHEAPAVKTINLDEQDQYFDFTLEQESEATSIIGDAQRCLLEPNTSILKAGAFKSIAAHFQVQKLHVNTHLYTAAESVTDWPGRTFEVLIADAKDSDIKTYAPNGQINVLVRNHASNPAALKNKFKLKDGGDHFLIGFRDRTNKNRLMICKRV